MPRTSLLYHLSHPAVAAGSYLFGTMHVRDTRAFGGLEAVYRAQDSCVGFATEFDLREVIQVQNTDALYLPRGETLIQHLGPRAYTRLRRSLLRSFGLDLDRFLRIRPMIVSNMIGEQILGETHEDTLDAHLWARAEEQTMQLHGLESYASQRALLEKLPLRVQLKSLIAIGRHPARFRRQTQRLANLYAAGELQELYQATRRGTGGMREALIFRRNRHMAGRIDALAREHALFAAVGAAHLPGGKGVLRLLKQAGWRWRPV